MKPEDRYHRFVQWSDEDQCYIGYCPDLYFGGVCHAEVELDAYRELCTIVQEEIAHRLAQAQTLPVPALKATRSLDFGLPPTPTAPLKAEPAAKNAKPASKKRRERGIPARPRAPAYHHCPRSKARPGLFPSHPSSIHLSPGFLPHFPP
jgi:hypothetical protein